MASTDTSTPSIERRSDLGLAISGTRITLYDLLDYLYDDWPPHLIRDWLNLTDEQLRVALDHIAAHRDKVEAEYRQVLAAAEESRRYWEERNRERFAAIAAKHADAPTGRPTGRHTRQACRAARALNGKMTMCSARPPPKRTTPMHDPKAIISQPDDSATSEEREREWEADERDRVALLEAWKTFRERHPNKQMNWSHELIEEERGDR